MLEPGTLKAAKDLVTRLERQTLIDASRADAVLKGALRTLDEGNEPSRNVTIRKGFEQYANIRRCVTLDPIAPGIPGADILFVRENVEDLYASIEHRFGSQLPSSLASSNARRLRTHLSGRLRSCGEGWSQKGHRPRETEHPQNHWRFIQGIILKVARDYNRDQLGDRCVDANFMIIDDGLVRSLLRRKSSTWSSPPTCLVTSVRILQQRSRVELAW